jgi:hypothetical protein
MRRSAFIVGVSAIAMAAAACGFEHTRTLTPPTAPTASSGVPLPSGGAGTLTGTWASEVPLELPASWACGSFQWNVTSQTDDSIAGDLYAVCAGVIVVTANGEGRRTSETDFALQVSGTAVVQNVITCPFALTGTGHLKNEDTLNLQYSGDTCLGPVHGEETLRRPADPSAPPPPPPSTAPPAPSENPNHVPPGPLTDTRAEQVVNATANEFAHLTGPRPTNDQAVQAAEELLLRIIWHLKLAGYDAGRQRNPSGAISNDKLTVFIDGGWRAYDVFYDYGRANQSMKVIFLEVFPASSVGYPGIPD